MELKISFASSLCATEEFKINSVDANAYDFGEGVDADEGSEPYGCGDMEFIVSLPSGEILNKYSITVKEYQEVAEILKNKLSFGLCGMCA